MKHQINTIREALEEAHDESLDENHFECRQILMAQITALAELEAMAGEPYGTVTVVRNPGCVDMHYFYRHPEPPYLDNAAECHTLYRAAPVAQQYEAGDVASASAQGFRDGVASVAQQPQGDAVPDEVQRVLNRLDSFDLGFDDCADAAALIIKMAHELKGPDGFATWKEAAIAERMRRLETAPQQAEAVPQPPADWEVFNTGAEVASGLTWEDASSYLTPARLARGWCAVLVVNKDNFAAQGAKT